MSASSEAIQQITEIRTKNNDLWMSLLTIALRESPEETRELLRQIRANDIAVTELFGKLGGE